MPGLFIRDYESVFMYLANCYKKWQIPDKLLHRSGIPRRLKLPPKKADDIPSG